MNFHSPLPQKNIISKEITDFDGESAIFSIKTDISLNSEVLKWETDVGSDVANTDRTDEDDHEDEDEKTKTTTTTTRTTATMVSQIDI